MLTGGSGTDRPRTYHEIQIENAELDGLIQRRKPGSEIPVLQPGTCPRVPGGYVWDADRGPAPTEGEDAAG